MSQMLLLSAIAGICGTGLGGIVSVILMKRSSENTACFMLSFAAGVMISIVCFGLVPEAVALTGIAISMCGLILGIIVIMLLNRMVDKITETKEENLKVHHTPEELYHESQFINDRTKMIRSGVLILVAIGLHNIPEGIAIGAGGSHDFQLGLLLAIMIALHNIPEGMAIAAPLLTGGVNWWKVVVITALSGAPTFIGGLIGMLIGSISEIAVAISLSAAGGAMLYVVFGEMMPQSIVMTKNRTASIITLAGILVGLIVTQM
jgi:ZIP family zinc transporter